MVSGALQIMRQTFLLQSKSRRPCAKKLINRIETKIFNKISDKVRHLLGQHNGKNKRLFSMTDDKNTLSEPELKTSPYERNLSVFSMRLKASSRKSSIYLRL